MRILNLLALLLIYSCENPQGASSGGGGSIPTSDELNNYINQATKPETKICNDLKVDTQTPKKFPIIYPSGKCLWTNEYSQAISDQLDKECMAPIKKQKINEGDLSLIGCKGYNYASEEEKRQFWILFLSAMSKPESDLDPNSKYHERDGSISTGMLQIDPKSANRWCQTLAKEKGKSSFDTNDMLNPQTNLECGLIMMQHQVTGVPRGVPLRQTQPQLEGRLFTGDSYWYWSVLSDSHPKSKRQVVDWFKVHAQKQLPFCTKTSLMDGAIPDSYQKLKCDEVQDAQEKERCVNDLVNGQASSSNTSSSRLGEQTVDTSCARIDNRTKDSKPLMNGNEGSNYRALGQASISK